MSTSTTTRSTGSTYKPPKTEAERERRRAYQRAYRAAHRDKVKRWQQNLYIRQAAKLAAKGVTSDD